ncbi:MAG: M13-type metalloendopeptidase [Aquabacterium sp.]|uniref:M13-type metalloendopeptidase n=1 Tax=Aquabacterium sp. TaxID=1872578 RepID=UPI00271DF0F4|nr:M13-type metalloendopeptidase [Aquabacterium sp.]MDO9004227.1 M13-type metalloendopeptidase [Aquabacterium sp.]
MDERLGNCDSRSRTYVMTRRGRKFRVRRDNARLGKPVVEDRFADPSGTLPTVINAAYDPSRNGIDIPAAFLQPPMYDPKADAAVNYCALGAVIGHEITHGFDSQGRLYDAVGNVRNWWAPEDAKRFNAQASKLIAQANAFQVLPGLHANGALAVGKNLADVGGVSLAYSALKAHLRESPREDVKVDRSQPGSTLLHRLDASVDRQGSRGVAAASDRDRPAPALELPGKCRRQARAWFYKAFGIRKGDPMWLAPKDRVVLW